MLRQLSTKITGGTVKDSIRDFKWKCPGSIEIHGIKNENWEFLKFIRKLNFISFLSEISPKHVVCPSSNLISIYTFQCVQFLKKKNQFPVQENNFRKIRFFCEKNNVFVSPAVSRGDIKGSLFRRLSARPSVRSSVCLSVLLSVRHTFSVPSHFFCPNAITQVQLMLLKWNFICG